jgi:membrane-associated phospholipid phosphatase
MIAVALALALTATDKVDVRPAADLAIGGVALVVWAVPEIFRNELAPSHCHLCDGADNTGLPGTGSSASLNGVDAWFHDATAGWLVSRRTADVASSVVAYGLVPLGVAVGAFTATGPHATDGAGWRAMAIVEESAVVSAAVVQGLKFALARKRPFVRYGTGETSGSYDVGDADSRASLPSGHTAFVTALGVGLATTATLEESDAAPWLWAAAALGSVTTGALRMMAEKHYFTDVAAGAAVGAACGVVIPLLHRRGGPLSTSSVSIGAQGPGFALSGRF